MRFFSILFCCLFLVAPATAAETLILQSTTSTQNSGLYDYLLPLYEAETGDTVRVVAVGTGQAITNGRRCDGDLLLIHSKADEVAFVEDGYGLYRKAVMYNDFVLVGPPEDPADIADAKSVKDAFSRLFASKTRFVSRGDNSGTHKSERKLWQSIKLDPTPFSGDWYLETGTGMGATLNTAVELNAYSYTDRATWLKFGNRGMHKILFEGDKALFNQYGIVPINPAHCPHVNIKAAIRFTDWVTSKTGQHAISQYKLNGTPLFIPNAE